MGRSTATRSRSRRPTALVSSRGRSTGRPSASSSLLEAPEGAAYPPLAFVAFQATFAIITVALVSGAIADRAKFGAWMIFAGDLGDGRLLPGRELGVQLRPRRGRQLRLRRLDHLRHAGFFGVGAIDFAGGTAVHINAGAAALALALVLGKRVGFQKGVARPAQPAVRAPRRRPAVVRLVRLQRRLRARRRQHRRARVRQHDRRSRGRAARLAVVEKIKDGKPTSVGAASGAVAGLVAITPACAFLTPIWAIVLGLVAGAVCALAIELKFKLGFDDSLDVVGIHLVGGLIGTLYLGFFANGTGLIYSGNAHAAAGAGDRRLLGADLLVRAGLVIGFAIQKTIGFRVKNEDEIAGIDTVVHGEEGYVLADSGPDRRDTARGAPRLCGAAAPPGSECDIRRHG